MSEETCEASGCTRLEVSSRFEAREQPGGPSHDFRGQWRWMGRLCCIDGVEGSDVGKSSWRTSTSVRIGLTNQIFIPDTTRRCFRQSFCLSYSPIFRKQVSNLTSLLKFDNSK